MPFAMVAAELRSSQSQQGPEPFPAGGHQMRGQLRDQRHLALHPLNDQAVAGFQIILDKRRQRGQGIFPPTPILARHLLRR